jgi:phenylacetate-CoA ligase
MSLHSRLVSAVILPGLDIIKKYTTSRDLALLRKTQWQSEQEIVDLQWQKLKDVLEYTRINVPFYTGILEKKGNTLSEILNHRSLDVLPLMDRRMIRENLPSLLVKNIPKGRSYENRTGGSTGQPLRFFDDRIGVCLAQAAVYRSEEWCGVRVGEPIIYLWGSNFDVSKSDELKGNLVSYLLNYRMFPAWNLDKKKAGDFINFINSFHPSLIIGYAGSLYQCCKLLDYPRHELVGLKGIVSSAETLFPDERSVIQKTFGVPVFNRYGGRDLNFVAQECEFHTGLHIAAERCFIEIVLDGQVLPPGELGEIVITRFDNWVMPFIRYRTGDLGMLSSDKCPCGRGLPLLAKVEGRLQDMITGTNGKLISGLFFAHMLKDFDEIKEFQIHQVDKNQLVFHLVTEPIGYLPSQKTIESRVKEFMGAQMHCEFKFQTMIPLNASGKRRITISHLDTK